MVTNEEYYRITNCVGDIRLPEFTIEEVQEFLIKLGYEIIIHKAEATIHMTSHDNGEVRRTGETFQGLREAIMAIKPGTKLPSRLDCDEAYSLNFLSVFKVEMKKKLLSL